MAPNIQILGSKKHIFAPSGQLEPHRSMFSTQKRCLIGISIRGYPNFYSLPPKNWIFGPNMGIFGPFDQMPDQKTMRTSCLGGFLLCWYSSPRLVVDWMEELIVGLLLVENAWCQKQSWSFMHLLCSGMVGFGLRRKLGTAGTERDSPLVLPPWPGGILILLAGFVLFSTVVFLGDLEIYFFVPVSRQ